VSWVYYNSTLVSIKKVDDNFIIFLIIYAALVFHSLIPPQTFFL